jgi:hypothetical protein
VLGLFKGFAYGVAVAGLIFFCFGESLTPHGFTTDLWLNGTVCYGAVVLLVTVKILYDSHNHTKLSLILIFLSVLAYYILSYVFAHLPFEISKTFDQINQERQFRVALSVYIFVSLITIPIEQFQYHVRELIRER